MDPNPPWFNPGAGDDAELASLIPILDAAIGLSASLAKTLGYPSTLRDGRTCGPQGRPIAGRDFGAFGE